MLCTGLSHLHRLGHQRGYATLPIPFFVPIDKESPYVPMSGKVHHLFDVVPVGLGST